MGPAAVAAWVEERFELTLPPTDVGDVVIAIGLAEGWFASEEEAAERAEAWMDRLVRRLVRILNEARSQRRPMRFDFNPSDPTKIQGYCFVAPTDAPDVAKAKKSRAYIDEYAKLVAATDDRQFEAVCRGALRLLGCNAPVLTRRSGDQGIDVFGEVSMAGKLDNPYVLGGPDSLMSVWIVGQAKKQASPVDVAEVREFVGAYTLLRQSVFHGDGAAVQAFAAKPLQPVWLFFLTTGRFTSRAWDLLNRGGIIALDHPVIAALLADNDVCVNEKGFVDTLFTDWVADQLAA